MLPAKVDVPTTPAVQAKDISTLYEIFDKEQKGVGAFSRVVVGRHIATNTLRAIKIMDKTGLVGKKLEMVTHEKEILRRTRHKSIVHLHECIETTDKVYFVLDLMQGDLFEYIVARKKLSEADTASIMKQLLSAVKYLHEQSVIHRDIKPENILIRTPQDIKLADFGLAKVVQEWDVKSTPCGTSFYIAPEIIRGIEAQGARPLCTTREAAKLVDVWSCGIVMFVMIAGRPPFAGQVKTSTERRTLLSKIDRGVLFPDAQWASVTEEAKDLVMKLLDQDISRRISAAKALSHPFFALYKISDEEPALAPEAVAAPQLASDEDKKLLADINAIQEDVVQVGDTDGEATSYSVEVVTAPAKVGPKINMNNIGKRPPAPPAQVPAAPQ
jgi:serine/threonine protein kinase